MATNQNEIKEKEEIIDLEANIDKALLESDNQLTAEMRELRDRTFLAHSRIENFIDFEIQILTFDSTLNKDRSYNLITYKQMSNFRKKFNPLLKGLTFTRKLDLLKEIGSIELDFYKEIKELNNIRNAFAHPREKIYSRYEPKQEYIKALKCILNSLNKRNLEGKKPAPFDIAKTEK